MLSSRPLLGMRVLDLTRLAPGPFASLLLADLGAEVIKVEEPAFGDPARYPLSPAMPGQPSHGQDDSALFDLLNRGKKSITCNLKSIQGRVIMMQLISGADILMEGFRPGVMERLGLNYQATLEANPRLVYASLSGFGQNGPYRDKACHDLACVALSGWLVLGGAADGAPALSAIPIADMASALWLALAVGAVGGLGVGHAAPEQLRERVTGTDEAQLDAVLVEGVDFALEDLDEQPHQRIHLTGRTLPVLAAEGKEGQDLDPLANAFLHHGAHALDPGAMPRDPWQMALPGPAAVAVHDDGDMPGLGALT